MAIFTFETLQLLHRAGWHSSYTYDSKKVEYFLQVSECPIPTDVMDFIKHFGGLRILHPITHRVVLDLTPQIEPEFPCAVWTEFCEVAELTPQPMYPIGYAQDLDLLMDLEAKVYAHFEHFIAYRFSTGEEAIDFFCNQIGLSTSHDNLVSGD